jgi:hypothetical protein
MRIDRWDRLELVIELIKSSLPVDVSIDLNHFEISRPLATPLPYDPRTGTSAAIPTPLPLLAEVRVSLCIDETLAWLLPVQFCMDQLLTAEEVVTKLADAYHFLIAWSQVHTQEGREHLRTEKFFTSRSRQVGRVN